MDAMMSSELSSQGPTRWAENQIRKAKKVLVFLSPSLLSLASADEREENRSQVRRLFCRGQCIVHLLDGDTVLWEVAHARKECTVVFFRASRTLMWYHLLLYG